MNVLTIAMISLRVLATSKPPVNKKSVLRKNLLKNIPKVERKRVKDLWKIHRNFFVDEDTMDVVVLPESVIDDYFDDILYK